MIPGLNQLSTDLTKASVIHSTSKFMKGMAVEKRQQKESKLKDDKFRHLNRRKGTDNTQGAQSRLKKRTPVMKLANQPQSEVQKQAVDKNSVIQLSKSVISQSSNKSLGLLQRSSRKTPQSNKSQQRNKEEQVIQIPTKKLFVGLQNNDEIKKEQENVKPVYISNLRIKQKENKHGFLDLSPNRKITHSIDGDDLIDEILPSSDRSMSKKSTNLENRRKNLTDRSKATDQFGTQSQNIGNYSSRENFDSKSRHNKQQTVTEYNNKTYSNPRLRENKFHTKKQEQKNIQTDPQSKKVNRVQKAHAKQHTLQRNNQISHNKNIASQQTNVVGRYGKRQVSQKWNQSVNQAHQVSQNTQSKKTSPAPIKKIQSNRFNNSPSYQRLLKNKKDQSQIQGAQVQNTKVAQNKTNTSTNKMQQSRFARSRISRNMKDQDQNKQNNQFQKQQPSHHSRYRGRQLHEQEKIKESQNKVVTSRGNFSDRRNQKVRQKQQKQEESISSNRFQQKNRYGKNINNKAPKDKQQIQETAPVQIKIIQNRNTKSKTHHEQRQNIYNKEIVPTNSNEQTSKMDQSRNRYQNKNSAQNTNSKEKDNQHFVGNQSKQTQLKSNNKETPNRFKQNRMQTHYGNIQKTTPQEKKQEVKTKFPKILCLSLHNLFKKKLFQNLLSLKNNTKQGRTQHLYNLFLRSLSQKAENIYRLNISLGFIKIFCSSINQTYDKNIQKNIVKLDEKNQKINQLSKPQKIETQNQQHKVSNLYSIGIKSLQGLTQRKMKNAYYKIRDKSINNSNKINLFENVINIIKQRQNIQFVSQFYNKIKNARVASIEKQLKQIDQQKTQKNRQSKQKQKVSLTTPHKKVTPTHSPLANLQKQRIALEKDLQKKKMNFDGQISDLILKIQELKQLNYQIKYQVESKETKIQEVKRILQAMPKIQQKNSEKIESESNVHLNLLYPIYLHIFYNKKDPINIAQLFSEYSKDIDKQVSNSEQCQKYINLIRNIQLKQIVDKYEVNQMPKKQVIDEQLKQQQIFLKLVRSYVKERYLWEWVKEGTKQ